MSAKKETASKAADRINDPQDETLEGNIMEDAVGQFVSGNEQTESEVKNLEQEVTRLTNLLNEQNDKYMRLLAEYDNFRKRSQKEREMIYPEAIACCAVNFLPVLDNLERAVNEETTDLNYKKGVEMIRKQFYESLAKAGIAEMEAEGAEFNPELHNAVVHIEDECLGENVVSEVLQKGFLMGDRVIR
ncbi:MAG: nucleotide exchange factor GrpE, partial [Clostridiales bacterium]|nr:nucleotide exchange factor GrpE [Clostridiales bacterium]